MAKSTRNNINKSNKSLLTGIWSFVAWLTAVLVSLAVGSGMINNVLSVPFIPKLITASAGWIVIILTLLSVILMLIDKLSNQNFMSRNLTENHTLQKLLVSDSHQESEILEV